MKAGPVVLGVAAIAAAGAIGYRVASDRVPAAAASAAPADPQAALAALEKATADRPQDAGAWAELGQAYFMLGRYPDAANAYGRATSLNGRDAELWSALGEARTLAGNAVTPDAHAAFARAAAIDPKEPRARYFLAVEKDVAGDHKGAVADWVALLRDAPPEAPWVDSVRTLVQQVAGREKIPVVLPPPAAGAPAGPIDPGAGIPGPSAEQMSAAAQMTPAQQDEMARGMVDRLAARLAQNPRDEAGWVRLMRARQVLGDEAGARAALASGKAAFAADAAARGRFDSAAATLGIAR